MPYLPKHYVQTGLQAEPGDFIIKETGEPYNGPYYAIATGQFFSGAGPQDRNRQELTPIGTAEDPPGTEYQQVSVAFNLDVPNTGPTTSLTELQQRNPNFDYQVYQPNMVDSYTQLRQLTQQDYKSKLLPVEIFPRPDEQDYQNGEFIRYFCKKSNELRYLELDKDQYDNLLSQDPGYYWQQYNTFTLNWVLTGDRETVYNTNRGVTLRKIRLQQLYSLDQYLQEDYLKFYKES